VKDSKSLVVIAGGPKAGFAPILLQHCVHWLFYSVFIALAFLWVAGAITFWSGKDVFWQRFVDGSLFIFSLVRVATAFSVHYEQITRTYTSFVPLLVQIGGILIGGAALVFYTLNLLLGTPLSFNVALLAIWSATLAIFYGLTCSLLDRRWLQSKTDVGRS